MEVEGDVVTPRDLCSSLDEAGRPVYFVGSVQWVVGLVLELLIRMRGLGS